MSLSEYSKEKVLKLYDYVVGFYLERSSLCMTCDDEILSEIRKMIEEVIK